MAWSSAARYGRADRTYHCRDSNRQGLALSPRSRRHECLGQPKLLQTSVRGAEVELNPEDTLDAHDHRGTLHLASHLSNARRYGTKGECRLTVEVTHGHPGNHDLHRVAVVWILEFRNNRSPKKVRAEAISREADDLLQRLSIERLPDDIDAYPAWHELRAGFRQFRIFDCPPHPSKCSSRPTA